MSVDPVIQSSGNSQSINPYSYIVNNPLAGTDPTGYLRVCDTLIVCSQDQMHDDNFNKPLRIGGSDNTSNGHQNENKGSRVKDTTDIGSQQSIAKQTPDSKENWTPEYVNFKKGDKFSDFSEDVQEAIKSLDEEIGNYRAALDRGLADAKENGGDVSQFEEAIEAFGHTKFHYRDKVGPKGDYAIAGFRKAPLKDENGNLMTDGKRTAVFYSGIADLYKNGAKATKKGNYTYKPIPKCSEGMFNLVSHEMSHTMVSRMYKSNGKLMKQYSKKGFEKSADDWAKIMGKHR